MRFGQTIPERPPGPWTINNFKPSVANDNNNTETENQKKNTSLTHHGEGG